MFSITLSSRYRQGYTYFAATVVSDQQFLEEANAFVNSVVPTGSAMAALVGADQTSANKEATLPAGGDSKVATAFTDGWTSIYKGSYVEVSQGDLSVWLFAFHFSTRFTTSSQSPSSGR